ncbi:protein SPA1-RELATED 4-like [Bidens hawaiensis]|uniref:protein SPA1-RELATED 4-like n=1 Tax=Bidens hawaiensis TaxID=980011 RepID=UPI004049FA8F
MDQLVDDMDNSSETDHDHHDHDHESTRKDISLRQWLDNTNRVVEPLECLHIFMQIVKIVNLAHSQGFVVHNNRPSCFVMSSFNHVSFIESATCSDSGSDSYQDVTSSNVSHKVLKTDCPEINVKQAEEGKVMFPMKKILEMETSWYTSPEEAAGGPGSCASDVYRLGVLLFELYYPCSSLEEKNPTMCDLKHRVFPPQLHFKWPKEAFFVMRLLHPDPASRPQIDEVLQSEFLNEFREKLDEHEAAIELEEKIVEQELLLDFLLMLQQRKQETADYLQKKVSFLTSDLQQVTKFQASMRRTHDQDDDNASSGSRKRVKRTPKENQESSRMMKNIKKIESAYFLARNRAVNSGWINSFMEGLSKYMSSSKLKVKADLKQGDLFNSSSLVCSLSFDRDGEFFATAGVNKKIKVFEYQSVLNSNRDIHFPLIEIPTRSKISSVCWNSYIKSQCVSSNFEGVVQVWDVAQGRLSMEMKEHERRAWSVDFSTDPKLLASGSDDGCVKLWNINQNSSIGTIRTKANACCVQFRCDSSNFLAFGSADHRVYYHDIRNLNVPLHTLVGHKRTISYIKFLDSKTLVSSSTDNTLKLWDLSDDTCQVVDRPIQSFSGHINVKNFVGLSISGNYIATGSETNEVFIYHKALPMPAMSYKFNTTDPLSGNEVDDNEQFISSVCWRPQSSTLVAANSSGNIKVLEMD